MASRSAIWKIDGNWDYAGFDAQIETDWNAATTNGTVRISDTANQALTDTARANAAHGTRRFNGFNMVVLGGAGGNASDAYFDGVSIANLRLKHCGKGGFGITNPVGCKVDNVLVDGVGGSRVLRGVGFRRC